MPLFALVLMLVAGEAARPPEALFFGLPTPTQRVVLTPPLVTQSGAWRCAVTEIDHFREEQGTDTYQRLLVRCSLAAGGAPPAGQVITEPPYVVDSRGRELAARVDLVHRAADALWLVCRLQTDAPALAVFSANLGPAPNQQTRTASLPLDSLGVARWLPQVETAVEPTLVRRETDLLDVTPEAPPFYYGVDSSLGRTDPLPETRTQPCLTVRLHTLAGGDGPSAWQLTNLRLSGAGLAPVEDWRYLRLPWRPDWGGWLGVTGSTDSTAGPGVWLEGVDADSPAARGGLRRGDQVLALDGEPVRDAWSLGALVRHHAPGASVKLSLVRSGRPLTLTLALGGQSQWPARDDGEFAAVWGRLAGVKPGGAGAAVLNAWDWQTRWPLPAGSEARSLELVFTRQEPAQGTTFLLRRVPLVAPR